MHDGAVHRVSGGELRKDRLALAAVELVALGLEALQDLVLILRLARRELLVVELVARGLEAKQGLVLIFRTLVRRRRRVLREGRPRAAALAGGCPCAEAEEEAPHRSCTHERGRFL